MIKLAIIGTGRMGTYHTRVATAHSHAAVTALVNTTPPAAELITTAQPTHVVTDHKKIIDHVDAAIIATPTPTHFAIARDFLTAGKHVLVEKPITLSYEQAEELFTLAAQHNGTLHVGHVERYNPAFMALQKELTTAPLLIRAVRSGPFHPRVAHDSVIMDLMIHDIDLVFKLMSVAPTKMQSCAISHASALPDTASTQLLFGNNTLAQITVHRGAATPTREIIVETPTQTLHADLAARTLHIRTADTTQTVGPPANANPLATQLDQFLSAVISGHDRRNAIHDLRVLHATRDVEESVMKPMQQVQAPAPEKAHA